MALHRFCRAALEGGTVAILGDGRQTRDFTYVGDVVQATLAAATRGGVTGRTYNIGGGSGTSIADVLQIVSEVADRPIDVSYVQAAHGDVPDTAADTALAQADLGFEPATTLERGIHAELDWLQNVMG
jgi:UDP-glucose 4-epimerase